jgi:hypothetical protein
MIGGGGMVPSMIAAKNSAPLSPAPAVTIVAGSDPVNVRCRDSSVLGSARQC